MTKFSMQGHGNGEFGVRSAEWTDVGCRMADGGCGAEWQGCRVRISDGGCVAALQGCRMAKFGVRVVVCADLL